ncbi:MAG: hypothetical protein KDD53_10170, partial [Bdellovibrionales bacterium]|nr:hypothetical protein [Bdellovibrionales bacterium]
IKMHKALKKIESEFPGAPESLVVEKLSVILGMNISESATALALYRFGVNSLDGIAGEDRSVADLLLDSEGSRDSNSIRLTRGDSNEILYLMLDRLPTREKEVLMLRYGLNGNIPHTLEEAGAVLDLSRERVRQLQVRGTKLLGEIFSELGPDQRP